MFIYILKLIENKYYIGKTISIPKRFESHIFGNGSKWTEKYKPVEMINYFEQISVFDEDNTTLVYMEKYGIENVRGGSFSKFVLSCTEIQTIKNMINTKNNTCFHCSLPGHFINKCPTFFNNTSHSPVENKTTSNFNEIYIKLDPFSIEKTFNKALDLHEYKISINTQNINDSVQKRIPFLTHHIGSICQHKSPMFRDGINTSTKIKNSNFLDIISKFVYETIILSKETTIDMNLLFEDGIERWCYENSKNVFWILYPDEKYYIYMNKNAKRQQYASDVISDMLSVTQALETRKNATLFYKDTTFSIYTKNINDIDQLRESFVSMYSILYCH